jgi:tetratricopeptide (TPR) repeat protein
VNLPPPQSYEFIFGDKSKIKQIWLPYQNSDSVLCRRIIPLNSKNADHIKEAKQAQKNSDLFDKGQHFQSFILAREAASGAWSNTSSAVSWAWNHPDKLLSASIDKIKSLNPAGAQNLLSQAQEICTYMIQHPKEAAKSWLCKPYNEAKALMAQGQHERAKGQHKKADELYERAGEVYSAGILGQVIKAGLTGASAASIPDLVKGGITGFKKAGEMIQKTRKKPIKISVKSALKLETGFPQDFKYSQAKQNALDRANAMPAKGNGFTIGFRSRAIDEAGEMARYEVNTGKPYPRPKPSLRVVQGYDFNKNLKKWPDFNEDLALFKAARTPLPEMTGEDLKMFNVILKFKEKRIVDKETMQEAIQFLNHKKQIFPAHY